MFSPYELFRSVEVVWLIWCVSLLLWSYSTWRVLSLFRNNSRKLCRQLLRSQRGSGYTLSYVMVIPLYLLLFCTVVETSLVLIAKVGTIYSAYSGARATIVWSSATDWQAAEEQGEYAAIKSFVPFASGLAEPSRVSNARAERLITAYYKYDRKPAAKKYIRSKYRYAEQHVRFTTEGRPQAWDSDVVAKVTYDYPFSIPGVGRILFGSRYYKIESVVKLQNEGSQAESGDLGIGYGRFDP